MSESELSDLQAAEAAERMAEEEGIAGLADLAGGLEEMEAAAEIEEISQAALIEGVVKETRGAAEEVAAANAAVLSEAVGVAGILDLAQGAEMLAASDDLAVQTAIVSSLSSEDLEISMQLASMAGRMHSVSNLTALLEMPVLSDFLEDQGDELHELALDMLLRFGATRRLAQEMGLTGTAVAELGSNEMAEGIARLVTAEELAAESDILAVAGLLDTVDGMEEVDFAAGMHEIAQDLEAAGMAEVAAGSAEIGEASLLDDMAEAAGDE